MKVCLHYSQTMQISFILTNFQSCWKTSKDSTHCSASNLPIRYCSSSSYSLSRKGILPASVSFSSEFWELLDQQAMFETTLRHFFELGMLLGTDGSVNPPANFPMRVRIWHPVKRRRIQALSGRRPAWVIKRWCECVERLELWVTITTAHRA